MKKILLLLLGCLTTLGNIWAQKIAFSIPDAASKKYTFILNKGLEKDTIQQGAFNIAGGAAVNIPLKYKDYVGIGELIIQGENAITLVVNREDFVLERNSGNNMKFRNSIENEYLYNVAFEGQSKASNNSLYAHRFIEILRFARQLDNVVSNGGDLRSRTTVRLYAIDKLDMDYLYTSGLWHLVVDRLARMSSTQEGMAEDMIKIFKRIKTQEVFVALANNVITMTTQYGWDDAFDLIVPYLVDSKRILTPQGQIYDAFKMAKIRRGAIVPAITGLKVDLKPGVYDKTLIMFYESDCRNCITQMEELKKNYAKLKASNIRIITISADHDKSLYEKVTSGLPWSDKLCDFKGFAGNNFANYGIAGTPTFYLLDKDLRLVKRFALFQDANL